MSKKKSHTKKEEKAKVKSIRFSYDTNKVELTNSDILDILESHFGHLDAFEIYSGGGCF